MIDERKKLSQKIMGGLFCLEGILTIGLVFGIAIYHFFWS